jgi:phosphodiesterase/alkaline phosphatase D-like protein/SAM-dependent methyltransferase
MVASALFACPLWGMNAQEVNRQAESNRTPDVIFVPTPQDVVDKMLELAKVKKDDLLYDLGCGDGRIVVTAAKRYGCKAVGYDIDPERVKESLENVAKNDVGHLVTIEQKDIFTLDLSKANVVTLYLLPELNVKLIPQLDKLKPGSRILSHDFRMRGVKPDKVVELTSSEDHVGHKVYLWTSPLKKRKKPAPILDDVFDGHKVTASPFIPAYGGDTEWSSQGGSAREFLSAWPENVERVWAGQEYWTNPLQDWRISKGRLECITSGDDRNVHLLTRQLAEHKGGFSMSVRLGRLDKDSKLSEGWVGFRIGAKGYYRDYRDSVLRGEGLDAGITTAGELFIGASKAPLADTVALDDIELRVTVDPRPRSYNLTLAAHDPMTGRQLGQVSRDNIGADQLAGNLALVCHCSGHQRQKPQHTGVGGNVRFWFRDWRISGSKVNAHEDQAFGPILFAQYTLSRGVMKMAAQMPPIGQTDAQTVRLQIRKKPGRKWKTIAESKIHELARTATFRIEDWDASRDTFYRLVYTLTGADGEARDYYWQGKVRKDPVEKDTIVVAVFTGNYDLAFPNTDIVKHVKYHKPDVLFFSGDNIYERNAGYGIQRSPLEIACLDYLRKWYLYGWAYADLLRDRPCVSIPDDHDVYQGNVWGAGGRKTDEDNKGGYVMDAEWVKMIERTQTSHLPDPYDPTLIEQGIGVYYTAMNYGRIGFAILEDRKFKSGCNGLVPPTKSGRPDHVTDPDFDPRTADVPGAKLLGDRQLKFLKDWAADWRDTDMKVALSQTVFANVATIHGGGRMRLVADYDSNGWPQTGRNKALRELRKAFAFMLCGDQHLATIVHHGIDDWNDAGWSFCVPCIANVYPRAWVPLKPAKNRKEGMPDYTGQFLDGLGNHVTVWAATNAGKPTGKKPAELHDNMPGYGIVRLNKEKRTITMECWPRYANPADPKTGGQYLGWPKTIEQLDNYGRKAAGHLPTIKISDMTDPVVQVIDQENGEIVYTVRINGTSFRPKVFKAGTYTIKVGELGTEKMKVLDNVKSIPSGKTGR